MTCISHEYWIMGLIYPATTGPTVQCSNIFQNMKVHLGLISVHRCAWKGNGKPEKDVLVRKLFLKTLNIIGHSESRWTMLLIRILGARIRTSLVYEGSLYVMSFKMVECWHFSPHITHHFCVSLFASRRCMAECCVLPYSWTMWLHFSLISYGVRMS